MAIGARPDDDYSAPAAVRKSVGSDIGERAFAQWLNRVNAKKGTAGDKNSAQIAEAIQAALDAKGLGISREGYLITRARCTVWIVMVRQVQAIFIIVGLTKKYTDSDRICF